MNSRHFQTDKEVYSGAKNMVGNGWTDRCGNPKYRNTKKTEYEKLEGTVGEDVLIKFDWEFRFGIFNKSKSFCSSKL